MNTGDLDHIRAHLIKRCTEGALPTQSYSELGFSSYNRLQKLFMKHRLSLMDIRREAKEIVSKRIQFERFQEASKKSHETMKLRRGTRAYKRHNKSADKDLISRKEIRIRLGLKIRSSRSLIQSAIMSGKLVVFSHSFFTRDSGEALIAETLERRKMNIIEPKEIKTRKPKAQLKNSNEYTLKEAMVILGFKSFRFADLVKENRVKRTRPGYYDKASIDAYKADMDERRKITPAKWDLVGT